MRLYFNADVDPEQISGKHPKTKQEIRIDNLCLWYSSEVFSSKLSKKMDPQGINGTIFTHGLFFAHEPEPTFSQNLAKNEPFASYTETGEQYINPSRKEEVLKLWERYPQIPGDPLWIRGG